MWSPGSPSLNTTTLALSNLKDRCSKQQKDLDALEKEKRLLQLKNEQLNKLVQSLDQDNMELREQNLEMSHELKQGHYEVIALRRHLDSIGDEIVSHPEDPSALVEDVSKVHDSMNVLKKCLLEQQEFVKSLIGNLHGDNGTVENCDVSEAEDNNEDLEEEENSTPNNSLTFAHNQALQEDEVKASSRICPMCEASFPAISCTHDDFVSHVNSHFTFEEGDTIHNFEVVDETCMI